jgi:small subunit ribosomal protein S6
MRKYEAVYILDPSLEEEQLSALVERFSTLVGAQGGEIKHLDRWERRKLAYEIKGRREGHYVVMNFDGVPATEAELSRVFGITDGVLRHMIVRMDERKADKQIAEAKAAAEAKARAAAEREAAEAAEAAAAPPAPAPVAPVAAAPAEATPAEAAPAEVAPAEAAPAEAAPAAVEEAPAETGDAAPAAEGEETQESGA